MLPLKLEVENFLAVKKAVLVSNRNVTFIVAPNKAGKTQLMLILYTVFWNLWRSQIEERFPNTKWVEKFKNVFLVRKANNLISWKEKVAKIKLNLIDKEFEITFFSSGRTEIKKENLTLLEKSPIYISPAGLGDFYKGIWALKKYYKHWKLVSEAITDLLEDLFITSSETSLENDRDENLLSLFEKLFGAKYFIRDERIFIQEGDKSYGLEKTASGLKSLAWYYLIVKYNLLGSVLFIDEPEVNLHPEYISKLAKFIFEISKNRKVFIATHSDYLLESFNTLIKKYNLKVDVWIGFLKNGKSYYTHYTADRENLIDTSPLNSVYTKILEELFGYEGEIEI
ncbi:MAG: hypothetical protein DSZ30_00020 [Aquificaceae bacterium]|nr:MAG: hypothetical protein DSZ30_00020 [Aquificaceae bacterium]